MRFSVLASGSGGNVCYVETLETGILIDAGLSCRELIRRLEIIKCSSDHIDALIITHEHLDHISGAGPISRRFDIPVFINGPTYKKSFKTIGSISRNITINTGDTLTIKDIKVETFTKCHDAADPIGVAVSSNGTRLGLITDLGRSTRLLEERLKKCQALIVEFNHDPEMLEHGSYPVYLKRRIKGPEGHLSNQQAGDLLKTVSHEGLCHVILAHLSEKNNIPQKALSKAKEVLSDIGLNKTEIHVSCQYEPLPLVEI